VRTSLKSNIYRLYDKRCQELDVESLGRTLVMKILDECKARDRKSVSGLDSFTANGIDGFTVIEKVIVASIASDEQNKKHLVTQLHKAKLYLKTEFRAHVSQQASYCATHCRNFALSDPGCDEFREDCDHDHNLYCTSCTLLLEALFKVKELVIRSNCKDENLYDVEQASENIFGWMKHIVRGIQQEKGKITALQSMTVKSGIVLSDWAMKVLPMRFHEKMEEWFGKRGMSLHIDVLFVLDSDSQQIRKFTYFTIIEKCKQDMFAVACIFQHVISQIQNDFPHITELTCRSDNAGCYSGGAIIMARKEICNDRRIYLKGIEFSEPQCGKDQADRDSAVAKTCFRNYVNEGHDLISAANMKAALDQSLGGLRNSKTCVIEISADKGSLRKITIPNVSQIHSIKFENDLLTIWRYSNIGVGKKIAYQATDFIPSYSIINTFPMKFHRFQPIYSHKTNALATEQLLYCNDEACSDIFKDEESLSRHILSGTHSYLSHEGLTTIDFAKVKYAKLLKSESSNNRLPTCLKETVVHCEIEANEFQRACQQEGWAINSRKSAVRLSDKQIVFLNQLFDEGERCKLKFSAEKALNKMRLATDSTGMKLFSTCEYLRKDQIQSYFSRLAAKKKAGHHQDILNDEVSLL
jgi:uncharacterized C2H2 Zn-finger protein